MLSAIPVDDTIECRSLLEESWLEALREHRYQSERGRPGRGRDRHPPLGPLPLAGFLRARWIEHMLGERSWIQLGRDEFGILATPPLTSGRCSTPWSPS